MGLLKAWELLSAKTARIPSAPSVSVSIDGAVTVVPTPLDRVEGKELEFEATDEGQFFEIKFSRDQNGKIVQIGPYIYQIQLGSQVHNGVIVVGK